MKSPHRTDPLRRPQGDFFHVLHALALNVRRRHHVTPRTFGHTLLPPYPESSPPIYPSAPGPYRWTEGLHPQHGGATLYDYVMDRVKTRLAADFEGARLRCTSVLATHFSGAMIERRDDDQRPRLNTLTANGLSFPPLDTFEMGMST